MGSDGWTQACNPGTSRALPWSELLSILCTCRETVLSAAPSPGRTRDGTWALKPGGTGYSVALPMG